MRYDSFSVNFGKNFNCQAWLDEQLALKPAFVWMRNGLLLAEIGRQPMTNIIGRVRRACCGRGQAEVYPMGPYAEDFLEHFAIQFAISRYCLPIFYIEADLTKQTETGTCS